MKSLEIQNPWIGHRIDHTLMSFLNTEKEFDLFFSHTEVVLPEDCSKRDRVAFEVLSSETTYLKMLQSCVVTYVSPIEHYLTGLAKKCLEVIKQRISEVLNFFKSFRNIVNVNSVLLGLLKTRFANWRSSEKLGDILLAITPFLKVYGPYSVDYHSVVEILEVLKNDIPQFASILTKGFDHPLAKKQTIQNLLITPVQRIPRYALLLKELVQQTPSYHIDYQLVVKAKEQIEELAKSIDDSIEQAEARKRCLLIQNKIITKWKSTNLPLESLVDPQRKFLGEAVVHQSNGFIKKKKILYLFNDMLLCTKEKNNSTKLVVEHTCFLNDLSFSHSNAVISLQLPVNRDSINYFFAGPTEKQDFLAKIQKAQSSLPLRLKQ
uniref:DH domain-containing protein n=1 Tax=Arcella intermedia TaxID=1963864 RepID=A0A6B2L6Y6_9EUKA